MTIAEMKNYMDLCLEGESSIDARKEILAEKRNALVEKMKDLQNHINYIDTKQKFYDDVQSGKISYFSNLIH